MPVIHDLLRLKALEDEKERERSENDKARVSDMLNKSTTTQHTTIPDMRDAYSRVQNSGYVPSDAEVHYRRVTSGAWVDKPKR